jgi:ferredoxin-type protein NapG
MMRSNLGLGLARSIGHALGVTRHLERSIREPVPESPPMPEFAVFLRPPGAIDELSFAAQCTKCDACIDACPPKTLVKLTGGDGAYGKAHGTPVLDPNLGGCTMCTDRPCSVACVDAGVDILDGLLPMKMGNALIHRSACRSKIGQECSLCLDVCPIEGAIKHDWRKIPVVDQDLCTGCGMCVHSCPVEPIAISIIPSNERPPKPPKPTQPIQDQNGNGPSPD